MTLEERETRSIPHVADVLAKISAIDARRRFRSAEVTVKLEFAQEHYGHMLQKLTIKTGKLV